MEVARLRRKQKVDPCSLSINDENRIYDLMSWSYSFFSPVTRQQCSRRNELKNIERSERESLDCQLARSFFSDTHDASGARIF